MGVWWVVVASDSTVVLPYLFCLVTLTSVGDRSRSISAAAIPPTGYPVYRSMLPKEHRMAAAKSTQPCPLSAVAIARMKSGDESADTGRTGYRTCEAIAARWQDFDLEKRGWSLPRTTTDAPRVIRLSRQTRRGARDRVPDVERGFPPTSSPRWRRSGEQPNASRALTTVWPRLLPRRRLAESLLPTHARSGRSARARRCAPPSSAWRRR
jgi:hypothetical protein